MPDAAPDPDARRRARPLLLRAGAALAALPFLGYAAVALDFDEPLVAAGCLVPLLPLAFLAARPRTLAATVVALLFALALVAGGLLVEGPLGLLLWLPAALLGAGAMGPAKVA